MRQIFLLLLIVTYADALFGDSLKKLREKTSSLYKKQRKGTHLNVAGGIASEYPGTNPKYKKINEDLWNDYYACLQKQEENLGRYRSMTPQAILGFEGAALKLECRICVNPQEINSMEMIRWEWAPIGGKHLEPVDYNENVVISPEDKTLHLYNLESIHSGQYLCLLEDASTAPYFITIISIDDDQLSEVHNPLAPIGPYPKPYEIISDYNLVVDTEWSDWSTCSNCDKIGKKHKFGYCTVYSKENRDLSASSGIDESVIIDENSTGTEDLNAIFRDTTTVEYTDAIESIEIDSDTLELFSIFQFGIPCQSHILPESIKNLEKVRARKNEIMTGFCRVKCDNNRIFVVKDKQGKIIEQVNNSDGLYSLKQPMPPLEPPVSRSLIYASKGKSIILSCPGGMNTDTPIHWQIADKKLIPEIIARESNKRIYISITDKIHIRETKLSDSNIYSCWQLKELAGTVRLVVEKELQFSFNHTVMLIGTIIIVCVFLQVFIKAFLGRKYAIV